jgi:hypothetical protein
MELLELVYIALGTIGILLVLHLGTFWVSRIIQPPKPKIVYVQSPPQPQPQPQVQQQAPPPPPPPVLSQAPPSIQLPTYDVPPSTIPQNTSAVPPMGSLPPPLETRSTTKQSGGDLGPPR